ncbi:protein kinase [Rhodococcus erythropolis]|uniref:Protein kinase n=1 Tax=Rhodococcus erythropolis TaxID=1833 RepID=A0A5N5E1L0_RHOER|nr:protein kinase [Rhodococcus erythropolis]
MSDVDPFAAPSGTAGLVVADLNASGFAEVYEIGHGNFGVVYRCRQLALNRTVAVKVLTSTVDRARFLREQRAAVQLSGHLNIVAVLHSGVTLNGREFIVMPYYAKDSLEARIRHNNLLSPQEALTLGIKIATALDSAHRLGIIHRDVNPGNILTTDFGEPALSDFGIAHFVSRSASETGISPGSSAFLAPEIVAGKPLSRAADVYGLGATLFAALTGEAVFEHPSGEQLIAQFLRSTSKRAVDPSEYAIVEDIGIIIERATSGSPRARPSAVGLAQQLRESQHSHGLPIDEKSHYSGSAREKSASSPVVAKSYDKASNSFEDWKMHIPSIPWRRNGELPLELTSFVDRRTEIVEAKNLLSTSRLVTLTGIGGVGKSRLAVRVAATSQSNFPGGVRLVELSELQDARLTASVVAGALGIRDRSPRPILELIAEFLAEQESLLVLDNCEHVIDEVARLIEFLLRACPDLRILATSRESIGLLGESVLIVRPLPVPDPDHLPRGAPRNDAMKLFVDRGSGAVPGFALEENNKVAIARICRRLDGLPLPIELAAARLQAMSPDQILQRLTERYTLLTRGSRGAPLRQQTLRLCIDWSYDLCTPVERAVWAQLSVFAGGFELEAAEKICGIGLSSVQFLDAVTLLVAKSILTREVSDETVRFRMVETLRDYGQEKAREAGEFTELRRRHRDWWKSVALEAEADWIGPRQIEWMNMIVREQSNLREALDFCVYDNPEVGMRITSALLAFWLSQGAITEGRHWLSRFYELTPDEPTVERVKAIYASSLIAAVQNDLLAASDLVSAGQTLADQSSDTLLHAHIAQAIGNLALFNGNLDVARSHLAKAVREFADRKILHFEVMNLATIGVTLELLNETDQAIECYERVLSITEAHGEIMFRSYALWALGIAVWRKSDRDRAVRLLQQSLRLGRSVNDRMNIRLCLQALAWISADDKDTRRAAVLLGASEEMSRSVGSSRLIFPGLLVFQKACEHEISNSLGERSFLAARHKGAGMGFNAAIDYALGEITKATRAASPSTRPTKREREVAKLVSQGLTNKEIAAHLVISPRTAQGHVEHLLMKLGFTSRAQIAVWFAESRVDPAEH